MKKILVLFILSLTAGRLLGQIHRVTIYASFDQLNCEVNYGNYDKLYPDSIKQAVMVDYQKKYQLNKKNTGVLLLRMNQDGWKLIAIVRVFGLKYLLSREIVLDEASMAVYLRNLQHLSNDKNDILPM